MNSFAMCNRLFWRKIIKRAGLEAEYTEHWAVKALLPPCYPRSTQELASRSDFWDKKCPADARTIINNHPWAALARLSCTLHTSLNYISIHRSYITIVSPLSSPRQERRQVNRNQWRDFQSIAKPFSLIVPRNKEWQRGINDKVW